MSWPGRSIVLAIMLMPVAAVLAGMAVYVWRALVVGTAPIDAELAARGRSALLGQTVRQGFAWSFRPLERLLVDSAVSPDVLTVAGCAMCALGALFIAAGDLTVGGLVVIGSAGLDFLDGRVARSRGIAGRAGEFLDSTLDRCSDAFSFGAAAILLRDNAWNLAAALLAFGAAAVVPYARAKAEALGIDLRGGLMQRPERVVLFSLAAILSTTLDAFWPASMQHAHPTFAAAIWFLALATTATALSRTREGLRRIRDASPPG